MRATLDGEGIIALESGSVRKHLQFDFALWGGQQTNPVVVVAKEDGGRLASLVSLRQGGSLIASVGLWDWAQLGLELPVILHQERSADVADFASRPLIALAPSGVGDLRFVPKLALWDTSSGSLFNLALLLPFTLPTGGATAFRGDQGMTFLPEFAATMPIGRRLRLGANAGLVLRGTVRLGNQQVGSEAQTALGAAYRFFDDVDAGVPLELAASVNGATSIEESFQHKNRTGSEARAQAGYWFTRSIEGTVGAGVGLSPGWGTPDWRVFAGLRYSPRPELDRDGDGVADKDDRCPGEQGSLSEQGCPPPPLPPAPPPPDSDGDGIVDPHDRCPTVPGIVQQQGCPDVDSDGDGRLDLADKCPSEAEDKDGFEDDDGCPDPDNDGDTVVDRDDRCPSDPGPAYNKGCPDPDTDGDGVLDSVDQCVKEKGVADNSGCPERDRDWDGVVDRLDNCPDESGLAEFNGCKQKQLVLISGGTLEIIDSVFFKTNSAVIEARSFPLLDNVAVVINAHPEITRVLVEGHTDNQGRPERNLVLSQQRSESVCKYLVRRKVSAARLEAKGFGQTMPIASNDDDEGRARNRRVVFTISKSTASGIQSSDPKTMTPDAKSTKGGP